MLISGGSSSMRDSGNVLKLFSTTWPSAIVRRLVHGVVVEPGDLAFDLLLHRQRVDQTEAGIVRDVHALEPDLAFAADRDGMHHGADRRHAVAFRASLLEARWRAPCPSGSGVPQPDISAAMSSALIMSSLYGRLRAGEELAAIEIRILAGGTGEFVHEALAIELVRGLSDAAPRADRHVELRRVDRVAIVRHVVARRHVERRVGAEPVFLHRRAHVERDRPAVGVETGLQARDAHRAIGRADEVLLARPEHVDRRCRGCAFAIMIACSAWGPLPLRPNPPPRWHRWRWTFCSGMPVIFDALNRVSCGL